jgi:hypothetical protein
MWKQLPVPAGHWPYPHCLSHVEVWSEPLPSLRHLEETLPVHETLFGVQLLHSRRAPLQPFGHDVQSS